MVAKPIPLGVHTVTGDPAPLCRFKSRSSETAGSVGNAKAHAGFPSIPSFIYAQRLEHRINRIGIEGSLEFWLSEFSG